ncbi:methyl-accepting chemotaxis protein [Caminicella sporogenes]|uniref:methyl-accepting chemotaxis protein n=1 Tax=Caminicella sporogenes TaxID=166485 RepID=UPI002542128F|nr:methyl-accepting chemotaxis protein [Caminicella sporogenes]WIF95814.1 methyl-accepting chemotaxis protein [Caminicella sporogenes]
MKKGKKNMRLSTKLLIVILLLSLLPLSISTYLNYKEAKKALEERAFEQLISIRDIKKMQIETYFSDLITDMKILKDNYLVKRGIENYEKAFKMGINSDEYKRVEAEFGEKLRKYKEINGYYDLFLITKSGDVVYTAAREQDFGTNLINGKYKDTPLAEAFNKGLYDITLIDFKYYEVNNEAAAFVSGPIKDENTGEVKGVVVFQIPIDEIDNIMHERSGLGETGETYIVGQDLFVRTDSRFSQQSTILKLKVETVAAKEAIEGKTNNKIIKDYRGIKVFSAYAPLNIKGVNWAILAEIDEKEVLANTKKLLNKTLIIFGISVIVVIFAALIFSRFIVNPIKHLMDLMSKAEKGDLTVKAKVSTGDEIEELANSFNNMIEGQRRVIEEVLDVSNQVGNSSEETSSASEEMASSAQNQSEAIGDLTDAMNEMSRAIGESASNVNEMANNINKINDLMQELGKTADDVAKSTEETVTTIVDVTNSLQQMNDSIELVASNSSDASREAQNTVKVANDGKKAVDNTIAEMDNVNRVMEDLREVVKGLGKAALQIGDIVEVIDDIAEQTNLLALNASIEAARAGEHGKGFAVVAAAIGDLAEKSGEATKDIAALIKKIQEEVENAVNTTDEGVKQVANGVNLVKNTGMALDKIFKAIENTNQLINEIAAKAEEQAKASKSIMEAVQKVNELSMRVSTSVEEQVASIEGVVEAVEKLNDLSQGVAGVAEEQSASSEEILATVENINVMTKEVASGSEEVAAAAENLAEQAKKLLEVVYRFKIS